MFFVVVFVFAEETDICVVLQLTCLIRDMSAVIFTSHLQSSAADLSHP
jgi:hypothetical protein